ncbi:MAG: hypothetical protein WCD18_27835 [Thermosynechococcaceae cyanobacterium]
MQINQMCSKWLLIGMVPVLAILSGCGPQSAPESSPSPVEPSPSAMTTTPAPQGKKEKPDKTANGLGVAPKVVKECPANAPVKGKEYKNGKKVYHVPDSPSYAEVKPTTCFADVAAAQKAGYKAPKTDKADKAKDG